MDSAPTHLSQSTNSLGNEREVLDLVANSIMKLASPEPDRAVRQVGSDDWPFPIALVQAFPVRHSFTLY
jgi:hypothetical protein